MKNKIATLLDAPMDRQSFLKNIGMGALVFLGLSNVLDALGGSAQSRAGGPVYGETDYGK